MDIFFSRVKDLFSKYSTTIDLFAVLSVFTTVWILNDELSELWQNDFTDRLTSVIDTSVSLAGFILAALTVIITFKSSVQSSLNPKKINKVALLFSEYYQDIVISFKKTIIELIVIVISIYILWAFYELIPANIHFAALVSSIVIIAFCVFRTLSLLFTIIFLDKR